MLMEYSMKHDNYNKVESNELTQVELSKSTHLQFFTDGNTEAVIQLYKAIEGLQKQHPMLKPLFKLIQANSLPTRSVIIKDAIDLLGAASVSIASQLAQLQASN